MDLKLISKINIIEDALKVKLEYIINNEPLTTIVKPLVTDLQDLCEEIFNNVNLISIALLIDDIFDITFSERVEREKAGWYNYSYLNNGSIGNYCRYAISSGIDKIIILHDKDEMALASNMTQRTLFLSDDNLQSFCLAPILINKHIVGCIQLSFKNELKEELSIVSIKYFLNLILEKFTWLLFSEQMRFFSLLEITQVMIKALESKNSYQANHSKNVTTYVNHFIYKISNSKYRDILFQQNKDVTGLNFIQLRLAALLHDIGKIYMSDKSLSLDKFETLEEKCLRALHPYFTFEILNACELTKSIAHIAATHHESIDSQGYPFGISKDELSVESQIISFADKLDSIARERPHTNNPRNNIDFAIKTIKTRKDSFSPKVFSALLGILQDYKDSPEQFLPLELKQLFFPEHIDHIPFTINTKTELDVLYRKFVEDNGFIKKDEWALLVMFSTDSETIKKFEINEIEVNNVTLRTINFDTVGENVNIGNLLICLFDHLENTYIGLHKPNGNKELAYAFCDKFTKILTGNIKFAAAFINEIQFKNNEILTDKREILHNTLNSIGINERWRLIQN